MTLQGRVAVVTGGGSGIGEAICRRLSSDGARVAVLDVSEDAAKLVAGLVDGMAVAADVSDSGAVDAALATVESELGPVDIWVNNAGVGVTDDPEEIVARAERRAAEAAEGNPPSALDALVGISDASWRRMLAVHLDGTFYGMRAAARSMVARGRGSIVNMASICGIEGCEGTPHYSAAKAGILGLTRAVAKELVLQGVRVNVVAPGYVDTPILAMAPDAMKQAMAMSAPLGRLGRPEEVAATVAFLVSDDASFFVGETLSPNGGAVTI